MWLHVLTSQGLELASVVMKLLVQASLPGKRGQNQIA